MKSVYTSLCLSTQNAYSMVTLNAYCKTSTVETPSAIQETIEKSIDDALPGGAAIVFIDKGTTTFYTYGTRSKESLEPITDTDIFEIGSLTKLFTTVTLAALVKQGLVKLDDPLELYLPEVALPQKNGKKITLRHLATHSSGLPVVPTNFHPGDTFDPYSDYTETDLYEFLTTFKLTREPGEKVEYSNVGMGLLGHILSIASHSTYEDLIKKTICESLGMNSTSTIRSPFTQSRFLPGYQGFREVPHWNGNVLKGAGFLHSTSKDMSTFLATAMGTVHSPLFETFKLTYEPEYTISDTMKIGLGWIISEPTKNSTLVWHNGQTGGFRCFMGFNVQLKRGVVILTNSTNLDVDTLGFDLINPLLNASHSTRLPSLRSDQPV
ncbi:beta-lactamase family protein [Candidatus Dependentiae bacterium]|nr:beta-lactamase family protein [Candidatus Dependentiae bacterium]